MGDFKKEVAHKTPLFFHASTATLQLKAEQKGEKQQWFFWATTDTNAAWVS